MYKRWKKRCKSFFKDKQTQGILFSMATLFAGIDTLLAYLNSNIHIFSYFSAVTIGIVSFVYFICLGIFFFTPEGLAYDEEEEQNDIKQNIKNKKEDNSSHFERLVGKVSLLPSSAPLYQIVGESQILSAMMYVLTNCRITEEERVYLMETLPKDILGLIDTYEKLEGDYKKEAEVSLSSFLQTKQKELNNVYKEPFQKETYNIFQKQLQQAKEKIQEKIYLSE